MSGVWTFKNGVVGLVENHVPTPKKVLVHLGTEEEVVSSHSSLEEILKSLEWERYYDDPGLIQYHKRSTLELISLPKDFYRLTTVDMYDIAAKNKNSFQVRNP